MLWETNLIMAAVTGSRLYGTSRPDSDTDIRGVCFSPVEALLGLTGFEQFNPSGNAAIAYSEKMFELQSDDVTIYALSKFFSLCLGSNPNLVEMLFVPEDRLLVCSPVWDTILNNRDLFLSTKVVHTFAGYSYSQLQRIQRHKRWLDSLPTKPDPYHYGLVHNTEGAAVWTDDAKYGKYQSRLKEWKAYATWRKNRNPARAELEKLHGYDTKSGSHLYRLVLEAEELLDTGFLTLPLKPAVRDQVLAVLHGEVAYEDVVVMAESAKDNLLAREGASPLPRRPDRKRVEQLLIEIQTKYIGGDYGL